MFLDMHGAWCAECGRPVTAWVGAVMSPCGCRAGVAAPSDDVGRRVVALPLPRRSTESFPAQPWEATA